MFLLGNDTVKEKYLHDIVAGRRGCNIALTEPDAGSALTHLTTTAVRDGEHLILNGAKSYVTGSNVNDLNATFVRFDAIPGAKGIGAVVVDRSLPGVTIERGPTFIGDRGIAHGNMILQDVRVPAEDIIVGPGQFKQLMTAFNLERLHNCGFWLGLSQAAFDEAAAYTQKREAFGKPILDFQAVYHSLADMWVQIEALRLLSYRAASCAIDGRFPRWPRSHRQNYSAPPRDPRSRSKRWNCMAVTASPPTIPSSASTGTVSRTSWPAAPRRFFATASPRGSSRTSFSADLRPSHHI